MGGLVTRQSIDPFICEPCSNLIYSAELGVCDSCEDSTFSVDSKYCKECSSFYHRCMACGEIKK
jgi:hypothetical protein